jgi:hypothetical protein
MAKEKVKKVIKGLKKAALKVKPGLKELLIPIPLHMQIWQPLNTVKIQTMLKALKEKRLKKLEVAWFLLEAKVP